jgi:O-antigen ligase/cytochrome c-type biogenesis protein CcmH/NrfG
MIDRALRGVLYGAIYLTPFVPLVVWREMYFPFVTGKGFAFRILVEIMTAAWLALAVANPDLRPRRNALIGAFAVFVVIVGLADVLGVAPARSLWSSFERMEGFVGLLHVLAFVVVVVSTLRTERSWRWLIATSLLSSSLAALYALLQLAGIWPINDRGPRVDGPFGNPGYLSAHMLLHAFLAALMLVWSLRANDGARRRNIAVPLWAAVLLIHLVVLVASAARASFVGLGLGLVAIALATAASRGMPGSARRMAASVLVAGVLGVGGLVLLRDTAFVQSVQPLQRVVRATDDRNVTTRLHGWRIALKGVGDRPLLGWGQENFSVVYNRHYDPRMHDQDPWLDRAHNVILDWLIAAGVLGLAAYLTIHVLTLTTLWRGAAFSVPERLILTGLTVSYVGQNLFTFDVVTTYLVWAMVLGFVASRAMRQAEAPVIVSSTPPAMVAVPLATGLAAGTLALGLMATVPALEANLALSHAVRIRSLADLDFARFEAALRRETFGSREVREKLADAALFARTSPNLSEQAKARGMSLAISEMEKQRRLAPADARTELYMAELYLAAGRRDEATATLEHALALTPDRQMIMLKLALNEEWRGEKVRAREIYRRAFELDPSFVNGRIHYIGVLIRQGEMETADRLLEPLIAAGAAADPIIVDALGQRGDHERIARLGPAAGPGSGRK